MKRNFKPGLRRDIERIEQQSAPSPPELPASPPPVLPRIETVDARRDTESPAPAAVIQPTSATTYPLHRDADTE